MIPVRYLEAAEQELLNEIGYLELRAKGLGRRFHAVIPQGNPDSQNLRDMLSKAKGFGIGPPGIDSIADLAAALGLSGCAGQ